jgi:hypothetical protein
MNTPMKLSSKPAAMTSGMADVRDRSSFTSSAAMMTPELPIIAGVSRIASKPWKLMSKLLSMVIEPSILISANAATGSPSFSAAGFRMLSSKRSEKRRFSRLSALRSPTSSVTVTKVKPSTSPPSATSLTPSSPGSASDRSPSNASQTVAFAPPGTSEVA